MQLAIAKIITDIPTGKVFDSHFVINLLIKEYSEDYLTFVAHRFGQVAHVTAAMVHGQIALEINKSNNVVRLKLNGDEIESRSETIHGKSGDCACWRKL